MRSRRSTVSYGRFYFVVSICFSGMGMGRRLARSCDTKSLGEGECACFVNYSKLSVGALRAGRSIFRGGSRRTKTRCFYLFSCGCRSRFIIERRGARDVPVAREPRRKEPATGSGQGLPRQPGNVRSLIRFCHRAPANRAHSRIIAVTFCRLRPTGRRKNAVR